MPRQCDHSGCDRCQSCGAHEASIKLLSEIAKEKYSSEPPHDSYGQQTRMYRLGFKEAINALREAQDG